MPAANPPDSMSPDVFYGAPPPPAPAGPGPVESIPHEPLKHGAILAGVGFLGTLVLAADFLRQVVVGAPFFEELLKFGLALVLVGALRITPGALRVLVGLVPGAAFGVFEHYVTYSSEPLLVLADRIAFHSGASAFSMALYHALAPLPDARIRWFAPLPSMLLHWANNFLALLLGVGGLVTGFDGTAIGLTVGFTLATAAHVGAWGTLAAAARVRALAWREWAKRVDVRFSAAGRAEATSAGTGAHPAASSEASTSTPTEPAASTGERLPPPP